MRRMQRKVFPNKQEMKIPVDEPVLPCLIITLHITRWTGPTCGEENIGGGRRRRDGDDEEDGSYNKTNCNAIKQDVVSPRSVFITIYRQ